MSRRTLGPAIASLLLVVGTVIGGIVGTSASKAHAQDAVCVIDPITKVKKCRIEVTIEGPDAGDTTVNIGTGSVVFRWERYSWGTTDARGGSGPALVDFFCTPRTSTTVAADGTETTTTELGVYYNIILIRIDTNETVIFDFVCVYPGDPVPDPPPPPPTEDEFKEAAEPLLTFETELNPRVAFGGITGLDTWFWCADPGQTPVGLTLRGWTAAATVDPVGMAWSIGGTAEDGFQRTDCGSEDGPAVTWQPQTKGMYSVEFVSTWAGTWTLTYDGFPAETFPLGPLDFPSPAIDYDVDEFVGVLSE